MNPKPTFKFSQRERYSLLVEIVAAGLLLRDLAGPGRKLHQVYFDLSLQDTARVFHQAPKRQFQHCDQELRPVAHSQSGQMCFEWTVCSHNYRFQHHFHLEMFKSVDI
jgi:hypothetical protein